MLVVPHFLNMGKKDDNDDDDTRAKKIETKKIRKSDAYIKEIRIIKYELVP